MNIRILYEQQKSFEFLAFKRGGGGGRKKYTSKNFLFLFCNCTTKKSREKKPRHLNTIATVYHDLLREINAREDHFLSVEKNCSHTIILSNIRVTQARLFIFF